MNGVPVPPGHPWACPTCQVTVNAVREGRDIVVDVGHGNGCPTFILRIQTLAPDLELDSAMTIRPGDPVDRAEVEALFPPR
jgi:hypothetical protein